MRSGQSLSAQSMARHNRDLVLQLLREQGAMSRSELGERIGASPATVNRLTTALIERGLILPAGTAPSSGGRPSLVVRFNESAACVAAVDVGSAAVRGAKVDLRGGVEPLIEREVEPGAGPRQRLDQVAAVADELLRVLRGRAVRCLGLGVGVPGVVDEAGQVDWAPVLGWRQVGLTRLLVDVCDVPTVVENDANALAIAEHRHGVARGASAMVAVNLGNGIGAGVIADGRLYRGRHSAAGEIGYMLLGPGSLGRTYGGFGDIESRVGAEGIAARSRELGIGAEVSGLVTVADVFALARGGDQRATALVEEISDQLAVAVANLAAVLDPGVVVLGGGIGGSADMLAPRLSERLTGRIPHVPEILPPSLGRDGVLIGVAELVLDGAGSLDEKLGSVGADPV